jgi:hypothetical protein
MNYFFRNNETVSARLVATTVFQYLTFAVVLTVVAFWSRSIRENDAERYASRYSFIQQKKPYSLYEAMFLALLVHNRLQFLP